MPRKHIHVPGTTRRRNYALDKLELALGAVIDGHYSFGEAAEEYGVPKTTIWRRYRGLNSERLGRPTALKPLEEKQIVTAMLTASSFGYPFTASLTKDFVQQYLNQKGVRRKEFKNNRPGDDWLENFQTRNRDLTVRLSENVKISRAKITAEVIHSYFDQLEETLRDVPPENCVNYDETNLTDDPGKQKVFVRRGVRHATRIIDSTKSSTSIMFAVTGSGEMLAPYVVFQAKNLYPQWLEHGPEGAVYNRSKSGWFDADIFQDWFHRIALPYFRRKAGKKVLIGDNLASHISYNVIKTCEDNNITFVLLPPNATHICQPLDVAVFGPLKKCWRKILTDWKLKNRGVVPKPEFCRLLSKLINDLQPNLEANIKAGFASTGLIPVNRDRVLKKLLGEPVAKNTIENAASAALTESFTAIMDTIATRENQPATTKRGKKLEVPPGKGVMLDDLTAGPSTREDPPEESEILDEELESNHAITSDEDENSDKTDDNHNCDNTLPKTAYALKTPLNDKSVLRKNMFVIISLLYNANTKKECLKEFLGKIVETNDDEYTVSCMRLHRGQKNRYVFPPIDDIINVSREKIKYVVSEPTICRGVHIFEGNVF